MSNSDDEFGVVRIGPFAQKCYELVSKADIPLIVGLLTGVVTYGCARLGIFELSAQNGNAEGGVSPGELAGLVAFATICVSELIRRAFVRSRSWTKSVATAVNRLVRDRVISETTGEELVAFLTSYYLLINNSPGRPEDVSRNARAVLEQLSQMGFGTETPDHGADSVPTGQGRDSQAVSKEEHSESESGDENGVLDAENTPLRHNERGLRASDSSKNRNN